MQRFHRILVGVELADDTHLVSPGPLRQRCANALAKATWLAAETGAALRIVHSLPLSARTADLVERSPAPGGPSPAELADERLTALADAARELHLEADHEVLVGPPARALLDAAEAWQADLIVVAGRNRNDPLGLIGSTAAQIFRSAPIPVWVTRRDVSGEMGELLAAVAFDEHSHGVLRLAAETARRTHGRLHVLHVLPRTADAARETIALDALHAWARAHAPDVDLGEVRVERGDPLRPGYVILRTASDVGADVVFIGPSKRSVLLAGLKGHVSTPLLRNLDCSLVCARSVPDSPDLLGPVSSGDRREFAHV